MKKKAFLICFLVLLVLTPIVLAFSGSNTGYKTTGAIGLGGFEEHSTENYKAQGIMTAQPTGIYEGADYTALLGPFYILGIEGGLFPVANFSIMPQSAYCEMSIFLDASSSYHENSSVSLISYEWDFDYDSVFETDAEGITAGYVLGSPGLYHDIALRITDDLGASDIVVKQLGLQMTNQPPYADAGSDYYSAVYGGGEIGEAYLDASGSYDPDVPCDMIVKYEWDTDGDGMFGSDDSDGTHDISDSDHEGMNAFFKNPDWNLGDDAIVELKVTDYYGASSTDSAVIHVVSGEKVPADLIVIEPGIDTYSSKAPVHLKVRHSNPVQPEEIILRFFVLPDFEEVVVFNATQNITSCTSKTDGSFVDIFGMFDISAFDDNNNYYRLMVEATVNGTSTVSESVSDFFSIQKTLHELNISLSPGWNLVSLPIESDNSSISAIMSDCGYNRIWEFDDQSWKSTDTGLTEMDIYHGYWVDRWGFSDNCTITVQGEEPYSATINITSGWNLVGYPSLTPKQISTFINESLYNRIWEFDNGWKSTDTGLVNMAPGKGYWIDGDEEGSYEVVN